MMAKAMVSKLANSRRFPLNCIVTPVLDIVKSVLYLFVAVYQIGLYPGIEPDNQLKNVMFFENILFPAIGVFGLWASLAMLMRKRLAVALGLANITLTWIGVVYSVLTFLMASSLAQAQGVEIPQTTVALGGIGFVARLLLLLMLAAALLQFRNWRDQVSAADQS